MAVTRMSFSYDESLKKSLQILAKRDKRSLSSYVQQILDNHIEEYFDDELKEELEEETKEEETPKPTKKPTKKKGKKRPVSRR